MIERRSARPWLNRGRFAAPFFRGWRWLRTWRTSLPRRLERRPAQAAATQNSGPSQVEPASNALRAKSPTESFDTAASTVRRGDIFSKALSFTKAREAQAAGLYPYFLPIEGSEATEVVAQGKRRVMIGSNNYLGL